MRKRLLLLTLLLAMFAPWAANAQETLTVCDGTTTNAKIPVNGLYTDTQGTTSEFIIPAETEGMSDMEGGTISKVTFYISEIPATWGTPTIQLYIGEVDETTLSSLYGPSNFTIVNTMVWSNQQSTIEVEFDEPYTYEGGNLLIGTYVQTAGGYKSTYFYGVNGADGCSRYNNGSGAGTSQSFLPKTTFTYEPAQQGGDVCEKPATLVAENVTGNSATLTWTGGSGVYNIELNGTIIEENYEGYTYSLTGLAATTAYTAKVQSVCDGSTPTSGWKTVSFTTPCDDYDIPYTYGFEEAAPFECWTVISGNITRISGTPNTGSYRLDFRGTTSNMIALPQFTEPTNTLRVEFYTRPESTGGSSGKFAIGYMTDITDASTFEAVATYNSTEMTTSYVKKTVDFVNVPARANIAMRQFDCSTNYYWYVDDVTVKEIPSCVAPTGLAANASTTSAELSWTANSNETAWTLYWKKTTDENYTEVANATNPYTLSGLDAATNYQYYVVANCSADEASEPSEVFTFTTECDVIAALGYSENFDSYTAGNNVLPTCWNYINTTTYSSYAVYPRVYANSSYSTYANSAPNCLYFYSYYSSYGSYDPQPQYAILPEMEGLAGTQVQLKARGYNTSSTFKIGTMSDPTDASTFTMIAEQTLTTSYPTEPFEYIIPANCTDSYLAIMIDAANSSRTTNGVYIDDIVIVEAPTCIKPTGLTVTANSVTAHTADITWESDASQWIVEYAKNSNFESPISENVSGQAALHIQGLDAETTYYVHVKADCGDSQSDWSSTVSFTTPVACPAPTALTCTNVTANTAELSWTDNANTTSWEVQYNTTNDFNDSYISASANGTPTITLDNLTPETTYYARVMAYCEGEGVSTFSNVVSFEPTAKLVIGSGNSTSSYLPSNTNFDYSFTQQIYTVEELGEAGVIESIDFYMTSTSAYTRNLDIYMVSTQKNSFENYADWIAVTDADLVYSGDVAFAAQAWTTITLDNGFIYDGTQNVAIIVDDNTGEYSSRYFKSFTASANQALYKYQDNNDLPITYTGNGSTTTSKNQIRILKSEVPDCVKPTALTATEVGPDFATIDWSQYGDVTSWNVEVTGDYATTWTANTHPFTIPGLSSSTEYSVRVSPACDETLWSDAITFTTLDACPVPENVEVSNITHTTANVAWTGYSDSYTMFYRETPGLGEPIFSEGFEGGVMPEGWISEGDASWTIGTGDNGNYPSITAHNGDYNAKQSSSSTGSNNQGYLVTPAMDLSGQEGLVLNFWYINRNWSSDIDGLGIYYRVDEGDWNELWSTAEAHTTWTNQTIDLPSLAANYQIGFMYTDSYGYGVGLDDIEIAPKLTADWTTINSATSPQAISGLTAGTDYEVKVQGFCGDTPSEESEVITFSTLSENYKLFVTEGDWKVANNWEPAGAPTIEQDVELRANVTITEPAQANNITQGNYTITIEDGGQLVHNNTGITATVKKNITGYGAENVGAFNNYYFISDPLTSSITPSEANGLLSGNYDLYDWNATVTDGDEWRNYKNSTFMLLSGLYGYLYANEAGTELSFTGTIRASVNAQSRYVSANTSTSYDFGSWALLGNPFVCDAYLVNAYTNGTALPFYRLTSEGNYEALTGVAIAPMEGIFYEAASSTSVYMSRTAPATQNNGKLNMNLRSNNKQLDNAILVFGDNQRLGKMSFRENSSKIYMPVEGKDYAIATAESNVGEMPVSFKAENNGSYTLSFNAEEVNFAYLHLIDNMTGIETDLLSNPSYSFEARTTDYANRFKLVFATGNADDTFAFFSNGSFVINNEGNATLQVIDVTGRIINSETINGCANVNMNAAPGVYMLRLVNGDNVKVQKVVVR